MSPARIIGRSIESMIADMVATGRTVTFSPETEGTFVFRVAAKAHFDGIAYSSVVLNETGHRLDSLEIDRCVSSAWRVFAPLDGYPSREDRT